MRLLFVGTKASGGGAESHMVELARAVAGTGHDVAAVVRPNDVIERALRAHGGIRLYGARFDRASDLSGTVAVLRAARDFQPDWLVGAYRQEYYSVALVARSTGARFAFFEHTDLPRRWLTVYSLPRLCQEFLVPSEYLRTHFIARGMPARLIHVLHNPVDVERLHPNGELRARMRERLGFQPDDVVVGYVGRIEPAKGSPVLADALSHAMREDQRIRALWVGDGRWAGELKQHIEQHDETKRHIRTGWVEDPAPYYAAMDLLALPTTKAETFGRASIEAQACGVPVLGSRLGGIPETLEPGVTGFLLPPGDVDAWSGKLLELADADRRVGMATRATEFVAQRFAARNIARRFLQVLETNGRTA